MAELFGISDPALADFVLTQVQGLILRRLSGDDISIAEQIVLLGKMLITYLER
jgi:hypothetical protein